MAPTTDTNIGIFQNNFRVLYLEDFTTFNTFLPGYFSLVPELSLLQMKIVNKYLLSEDFLMNPFCYIIKEGKPVPVEHPTEDALNLISVIEDKMRLSRSVYGKLYYGYNNLERDYLSNHIRNRIKFVLKNYINNQQLTHDQTEILNTILKAHQGKSPTDILREYELEENLEIVKFDKHISSYLKGKYENNLA